MKAFAPPNWFKLLDAVAAGETVVIDRNGRAILLRRAESLEERPEIVPEYGDLLRLPDPDRAAEWGWSWTGDVDGLEPTEESTG